jgi:hypothetical protein
VALLRTMRATQPVHFQTVTQLLVNGWQISRLLLDYAGNVFTKAALLVEDTVLKQSTSGKD